MNCDLKLVKVIICLNFKIAIESLLQLFRLSFPCTVFEELMNSSFMIATSNQLLSTAVKNFKLPSRQYLKLMALLFVFEIYWFDFVIFLQINGNLNSLDFMFPFLNLQSCFSMNCFKINDCWRHFIFAHFAERQVFE